MQGFQRNHYWNVFGDLAVLLKANEVIHPNQPVGTVTVFRAFLSLGKDSSMTFSR